LKEGRVFKRLDVTSSLRRAYRVLHKLDEILPDSLLSLLIVKVFKHDNQDGFELQFVKIPDSKRICVTQAAEEILVFAGNAMDDFKKFHRAEFKKSSEAASWIVAYLEDLE
jgi:hypothetical protein